MFTLYLNNIAAITLTKLSTSNLETGTIRVTAAGNTTVDYYASNTTWGEPTWNGEAITRTGSQTFTRTVYGITYRITAQAVDVDDAGIGYYMSYFTSFTVSILAGTYTTSLSFNGATNLFKLVVVYKSNTTSWNHPVAPGITLACNNAFSINNMI